MKHYFHEFDIDLGELGHRSVTAWYTVLPYEAGSFDCSGRDSEIEIYRIDIDGKECKDLVSLMWDVAMEKIKEEKEA